MEVTVQELAQWEPGSYMTVDMRSEETRAYGMLPGAVPVLPDALFSFAAQNRGKKLVLYCAHGEASLDAAQAMCEQGFAAYSLAGGYLAWLREELARQDDEQTRLRVETSLRKRFREKIWCNFTKAVRRYELVQPNDRIAVCISGGKDSMLMAILFQELKLHNKYPFEVKFLVMDPGYSPANRQIIEGNLRRLGIEAEIFETDIFGSVYNVEKSPCYLCARMRRGHLYSKAKELGCNKIALGHHFNDVIETTVMSMFYGSQLQAMPPKLHSTSFPGMTLIRPMYCIREEDILAWKRYNDLEFIQCACRFTENCTMCDNGGGGSKRQETKILLRRLKRDNPNIENSIFRSIHAVALDTMPGYKSEGVEHSFLERFHEMEERQ